MKKCSLYLKNISSLVTCKPKVKDKPKVKEDLLDVNEIKDGAVLISGSKIYKVGATEEIEKYIKDNKIKVEKEVSLKNFCVTPGLIDPHTHIVFAGSREEEFAMRVEGKTYLEILNAGGGILNTLKHMRNISESDLHDISKKRILNAFMHGTTSIEIKSGYGLDFETEIKTLKVCDKLKKTTPLTIVSTYLGAHAIPNEYKNNRKKYIELITNEVIPYVAKNNLATFNDVFVEEGAFTASEGEIILNSGKQYGLIPKVHADELTCCGGAELAARVKAISADHLLMASDNGLKMMCDNNVVAVALPGTLYSLLTNKYLDFKKLYNLGLPIALATDANPGSNMCINMQTAINQAVCLMKVPVNAVINMATINAACAIGINKKYGSIEEDKIADLVIFDCDSYKYIPYSYGTNLVKFVIKNGIIYKVSSTFKKL